MNYKEDTEIQRVVFIQLVHKHNANGLICAFLTCHLWLCGAHGVFLCIHFCFIFNTVCNGL
jgi:hypothetical protein